MNKIKNGFIWENTETLINDKEYDYDFIYNNKYHYTEVKKIFY